ncbi:hypothetical protein ES288_D13G070900v1 [Gossypium darwinii]|uniref:Uncharacterized protein n=1 Tax=Gossypium darwinii TaxID=34276 RepID=A0A5D1ZVY7_GOSDA|nr:hypothetical protein ES288_D13G070900v1 [Gossypium darwinii]
MKNQILGQVIVVPVKAIIMYGVKRTPRRYLPDSAGQNFVLKRINNIGKKADTFAHGVREHVIFGTAVRVGPKISETVNGKLSLGERILQVGGVEKIFKQLFIGPIAGLLSILSQKVGCCSDRSNEIPSTIEELVWVHYKVCIYLIYFPLSQIVFKYLQQAIFFQRLLHDVLQVTF